MKRTVWLCVILLCSIGFTFAQGEDAGLKKSKKPIVRKKIVASPFAKAEKAWIPFYANFREIINNQNKKGLLGIMSDDFSSTFGEKKDEYLKTMIREESNRWELLESMKKVSKLLRKGNEYLQSKKYLRKIVAEKWYDNGKEMSACKNSKNEEPCGPESLVFEFRNSRWVLVTTDFCECE